MRTIKITTVLLAIPLGIYLAAAPFVRYAWDDFCTASIVHHYGFWAAQRYWYVQWTGRFSFTAIISLVELVGPETAQVMPILMIATFFIVLAWSVSRLWHWLGASSARWPAAFIALAVIYASLLSNPQIGEVLYWQTGLLTYPLGLTVFAAVVGLILGRSPILPIIFLLAAVGSGFTEAVSAGQTGFFAVALAAASIFGSPRFGSRSSASPRSEAQGSASPSSVSASSAYQTSLSEKLTFLCWPLAAALAGSLVGTAIVFAAPGNAIRIAALHNPPFDPVYFVLRIPKLVAASLLISGKSPLLLAILFGGGIASAGTLPQLTRRREADQRISLRAWLVFAVGSLIVLAACVAPSAYGRIFMGRTQMIPQFFSSLATVTFGVLIGLSAPAMRRATAILLVVLAAVSSAWQTTHAALQLPAARTYARQFDQRNAALLSSAEVVDPLQSTTLILSDGATADPNYWINRCEADYYDLPSVRTSDGAPTGGASGMPPGAPTK